MLLSLIWQLSLGKSLLVSGILLLLLLPLIKARMQFDNAIRQEEKKLRKGKKEPRLILNDGGEGKKICKSHLYVRNESFSIKFRRSSALRMPSEREFRFLPEEELLARQPAGLHPQLADDPVHALFGLKSHRVLGQQEVHLALEFSAPDAPEHLLDRPVRNCTLQPNL